MLKAVDKEAGFEGSGGDSIVIGTFKYLFQ